ncbi:hypothetical protein GCM10010406_52020 [Streptomyces thermolineatus]|uniref:Uncharacterized protein n=1 Tax=Streptomyces thermolineatus TaxID=44033 RepID=A0ABP6A5J2_9ACTN
MIRSGSDGEQPELHTDRIGDTGQVVGVAGDHRSLVPDRDGHDRRVHRVGGPGSSAGDSGRAAGPPVVGEGLAALEHPGDPVRCVVRGVKGPTGGAALPGRLLTAGRRAR